MLFELSNYWIFLVLVSAVYLAITNYSQGNIGGKNRLKNLQIEMKELHKKMTEASKNKNEKELNETISSNWKLTSEIMAIQMKMMVVLFGLLFAVSYLFPMFEPGMQDDVRLSLFDDGLPSHCDVNASDGIFSNCFALPANGTRGAWVLDAFLFSAANESLSRSAAPIYYEGGVPEDIWLQSHSQSGFLDGMMGKTAYLLNTTTDKQNYSAGETVAISVSHTPAALSAGSRIEAVLDSGTFFHVDLPVPLPLINIRRIIGSYGVFLLSAFLMGILYSIGKAAYVSATKKQ